MRSERLKGKLSWVDIGTGHWLYEAGGKKFQVENLELPDQTTREDFELTITYEDDSLSTSGRTPAKVSE